MTKTINLIETSVFWGLPEWFFVITIITVLFLPQLNDYKVVVLGSQGWFTKKIRINFFFLTFLITSFLFFLISYKLSLLPENPAFEVFNRRLIISSGVCSVKGVIFLLTALTWKVSSSMVRQLALELQTGYGVFMGCASMFLCLLISSNDFFTLFFCLECASTMLYILTGFNFGLYGSKESSLKYFILGSISSGMFIFGVGLLFTTTGTVDFTEVFNILEEVGKNSKPYVLYIIYSLFLFSLFFKLSIFPCHFWTPDVYDRLPLGTLMYFSVVVKFAVFIAFLKLNFFVFYFLTMKMQYFLIVGAVGSMVVGSLGALGQTRIHRFFGYTSINQMGFLICSLVPGTLNSIVAFLFYFYFYILATVIVFLILSCYHKNTDGQYKHLLFFSELVVLGKNRAFGHLLLPFAFLSMAGIPPFGGFLGKFLLLRVLFGGGHYILFFVIVFTSIVSLFYYFRVLKLIFFNMSNYENKQDGTSYVLADRVVKFCIFFAAALLFVIGPIFLDTFWDFFESTARSILIFKPQIASLL